MKNRLEENLELRKALAEVDRLTSENELLKNENSELKDKYRRIKLRITNQIYLFKTNHMGAYEVVRIIQEILEPEL
tara:strand:+ start:234 stop:461 length:228 start_codon:yes stop_codon:yes gene_type:complete